MDRHRTVSDYLPLLEAGYVLVGGQAVNLWAQKYVTSYPRLGDFYPFTSRDADFVRTAQSICIPPGWSEAPLPSKGRMRVVSQILKGPDQQEAEILTSVNGLTKEEIQEHCIPISFSGTNAFVLSPVALFQAKLANVKGIPQEQRQDLKHIEILVIATKAFITDLLQGIPEGSRPKRAIKWLNQHHSNVKQAVADNLLPYRDWCDYLPVPEMQAHPNSSIKSVVLHLQPIPKN